MNQLFKALKQAGLVTEEDLERAVERDRRMEVEKVRDRLLESSSDSGERPITGVGSVREGRA